MPNLTRFLVPAAAITTFVLGVAPVAAPALASGGSAGGGGASTSCGDLTFAVTPGLSKSETLATGWFNATGTTSRACDGSDHYLLAFSDASPDDGCVVIVPVVRSSTYQPKYGSNPFSRYESMFQLGGWCAHVEHTLTATLSDVTTGQVLAQASATYTP